MALKTAAEATTNLVNQIQRSQSASSLLGTALRGIQARLRGLQSALTGAAFALSSFSYFQSILTTVPEIRGYEEIFARIQGLTTAPQEDIEAWRGEVARLARQYGKSGTEVADALFFIASSGFTGKKAIDVLDAAVRGSISGLGDAKTIADAVTSALNAYAGSNLTAEAAVDAMAEAVRQGKMEASDLAGVMSNVLPLAAKLGISFQDVAGILAVMSRTGASARDAAFSVRSFMSVLLKPSKQARETLESLGLSVEELKEIIKRPGGLLEAMRSVARAARGNEEAVARAIPQIAALKGVMNVLAQDAASVDDAVKGVLDSSGALGEAFGAVATTQSFRFSVALASVRGFLEGLASAVLPAMASALNDVAERVRPIVDWMGRLSSTSRLWVGYVFTFIAALGPLLVLLPLITSLVSLVATVFGTFFSIVVSGVATIIPLIASLTSFLVSGLLGALTALPAIIAAVFNPFGLFLMVVVGLVGFLIVQLWRATGTLDLLKESLGSLGSETLETFAQIWETVGTTIEGIVNAVKAGDLELAFKIAWTGIQLVAAQAGLWIVERWYDVVFGIQRMMADLSFTVSTLFQEMVNTIGRAFDWLMQQLGLMSEETAAANERARMEAMSAILQDYNDQLAKIQSSQEAALKPYKDHVSSLQNELKSLVSQAAEKAQNVQQQVGEDANKTAEEVTNATKDAVEDMDQFNKALDTARLGLQNLAVEAMSWGSAQMWQRVQSWTQAASEVGVFSLPGTPTTNLEETPEAPSELVDPLEDIRDGISSLNRKWELSAAGLV